MHIPTATPTPTPSPSPSPTDNPTAHDPIQEHLSVIVGVPVGLVLALLFFGICILWMVVSQHRLLRSTGVEDSHGVEDEASGSNMVRLSSLFIFFPPSSFFQLQSLSVCNVCLRGVQL